MSHQHFRASVYVSAANVLAVLAFFSGGTLLSAQAAVDTVSDASRVRITVPSSNRIGQITRLDSLRRDTLFLARVPPISTDQVHSLELSLGKSSRVRSTARGMLAGFLVGSAVGAVIMTAGVIEDERNPCGDCYFDAKTTAAVLTGATLILTTSVGTIVGLVRRPERWARVRLH